MDSGPSLLACDSTRADVISRIFATSLPLVFQEARGYFFSAMCQSPPFTAMLDLF